MLAARKELAELEQIVATVEGTPDTTLRVSGLTLVASSLFDSGETVHARELFSEVHSMLSDLDSEGRARYMPGLVALHMAPFDYNTSRDLIKTFLSTVPEKERSRFLGTIAQRIAGNQPEEAEKALNQVIADRERENLAVRVAYGMAATDPKRAERIVRRLGSNLRRAYGLGLLAQGATRANEAFRLALLEEAWQILQDEADAGRRGTPSYRPMTVAVGLLPAVEQISPDRLNEFFWRVLSLRSNWAVGKQSARLGSHGPHLAMRMADPVLGAALARYDSPTAKLLTMTPGDETLDLGFSDAPYFFFGALTMLDPETAVRAVASMSTENEQKREDKLNAWKQVLSLLNKSTQKRWEHIMDTQYHLWQPGKVDF